MEGQEDGGAEAQRRFVFPRFLISDVRRVILRARRLLSDVDGLDLIVRELARS